MVLKWLMLSVLVDPYKSTQTDLRAISKPYFGLHIISVKR